MGYPSVLTLPGDTKIFTIRYAPAGNRLPPTEMRYEITWPDADQVQKLDRLIFEEGDQLFEVLDKRKFHNGRHRLIVRPVEPFETVARQVRRGNLIRWSFSSQRSERDYSYQRVDRIQGRVATIRDDENFLDLLTRTRIELLGAEDHGPFFLDRNTKVTVLDGREYTDD